MKMITPPYENELIYSAMARYHYYTENPRYTDTMQDLYNNRRISVEHLLGTRLELIADRLGGKYSADYLIDNHTIFHYFSPFLRAGLYEKIRNTITFEAGGTASKILAINSERSIGDSKIIRFCPLCASEDSEEWGEAFIHREHHLMGINVCVKHFVPLVEFAEIPREEAEFIRLDYRKILGNCRVNKLDLVKKKFDLQCELACMANKILSLRNLTSDSEKVAARYVIRLKECGYARSNGAIISKEKLQRDFLNFYGQEFLYSTKAIYNYKHFVEGWFSRAFTKYAPTIHPFRHLLIMKFLDFDINELFYKIGSEKFEHKFSAPKQRIVKGAILEKNKSILNNVLKDNPGFTRSQLLHEYGGAYNHVRKYDPEWLENILPRTASKKSNRIDWEKRDEQYVKDFEQLYVNIIKEARQFKKITPSYMLKRAGKDWIRKKYYKLPELRNFLINIDKKFTNHYD